MVECRIKTYKTVLKVYNRKIYLQMTKRRVFNWNLIELVASQGVQKYTQHQKIRYYTSQTFTVRNSQGIYPI